MRLVENFSKHFAIKINYFKFITNLKKLSQRSNIEIFNMQYSSNIMTIICISCLAFLSFVVFSIEMNEYMFF